MAHKVEYVINGPASIETGLLQPLHKPLSIRREHKATPTDLRTLFRHSASDIVSSEPNEPHLVNGVPATPVLPPTPPTVSYEAHTQGHHESSEVRAHRSSALTPVHQHSPPTPDNTPPRDQRLFLQPPVLATQLSLVSTLADSFKTAAEDLTSDNESLLFPDPQYNKLTTHVIHRQLSPPGQSTINQPPENPSIKLVSPDSPLASSIPDHLANSKQHQGYNQVNLANACTDFRGIHAPSEKDVVRDQELDRGSTVAPLDVQYPSPSEAPGQYPVTEFPLSPNAESVAVSRKPHPGANVRLNPRGIKQLPTSTSAEKLANIIGWRRSVDPDYRRASGMSTTSTTGEIDRDLSPLSGRRLTLRKTAKNISLRSASSPLPDLTRTYRISSNDSPHRLVHKKVRLSNENRLSFSSEPPRPYNITSRTVSPRIEVIKVAVISDGFPSLQSSAVSSSRQSLSGNSNKEKVAKTSSNASPWQEDQASAGTAKDDQGPIDFPQHSSYSACASSSTSRANSITSATVRVQRREAEKDLRRTLDRMESERLLSSLQGLELQQRDQQDQKQQRQPHQQIQQFMHHDEVHDPKLSPGELMSSSSIHRATASTSNNQLPQKSIAGDLADQRSQVIVTPGASEWTALRAPSVLYTPFSQPSYQSGSPEINEATAVNIFAHNNHSVQIIESNMTQESRAVQALRRDRYLQTQSPLQNPRPPPLPPKFGATPVGFGIKLDQHDNSGELGSARRTPSQARNESLAKALGSGVSLKNAKNPKASQDLDSSLYPFWRPRPFWDGVDNDMVPATVDRDPSIDQEGSVNNSLGFPQRDTVLGGPASLIRRISQRRRRNRAAEEQTSTSSSVQLRANQNMYKNSVLGISLKPIGIREIQQRIFYAKQRKEDEKREKRRAALRERIGTNIISQGDSRFPATSSGFIRV